MKTILFAVDNSKGSEQAAHALARWTGTLNPEKILLVHVQKLYGHSIMGEALESDQDLRETSAALKDTEYQAKLDTNSEKIIVHFTKILEQAGFPNVKAMILQGHPAEKIVSIANDEAVDLIVLGSRGKRFHSLLLGSVSREVANTADVSVLVAR